MQVWKHIGKLIFNMPVLVEAIKISDRMVRELMRLFFMKIIKYNVSYINSNLRGSDWIEIS